MRILKKSRGFIPFLLVLLILFPSLGSSEAGVRVAVLPFKVYSEKELGYLKRAVMDMLTSRIGSAGNITIVRSDLAANAVKKYPDLEFTEKEILEDIGKELGADYVLFGREGAWRSGKNGGGYFGKGCLFGRGDSGG